VYDCPMTSTDTPSLPAAVELAAAMGQIRDAETFAEFSVANDRARELGLRLRRGFWGQRRVLSPGLISMVASCRTEVELKETLQDINYSELIF